MTDQVESESFQNRPDGIPDSPNSNPEVTESLQGLAVNPAPVVPYGVIVSRSLFGGSLMGLANLVPGISGGTMLLAAGIYPKFIESLADVTRFKFRFSSLLTLMCVVLAAGLAVLLLAGTLKELVVDHRWVMYSLFIGLTLGGLPVVWGMAKPASSDLCVTSIIAIGCMLFLAYLQATGYMGTGGSNVLILFAAGLAGASAMILPGLSGGYLLLLMGQYVPILKAIDEFKDALSAGNVVEAMDPALTVLIPVGLGVVAGVVMVGNLLKFLLSRYRKATLGFLLGLLIGSVAGLWPFQVGEKPQIGDTVKGQVVTAESLPEIDQEDWPTRFFRPSLGQVGGSAGLVIFGFGITMGVAMIGGKDEEL
ncbi:MAG: DUF368 domain-containing protein [Mariniblastus sp.]|nr:DUF368 domain-containing protein [Mariniblastus sp.]